MKAIKEKDPEFYKFLVENDRALLDFRAPEEEAGDEGEDDSKMRRTKRRSRDPRNSQKPCREAGS